MPTILVAEDEPVIAEVIRALLEEEGYDVIVAYDGADALECFSNHECDLVIADLMMPHVDGRALRAQIAAGPRAHVPVLLMTAAANLDADDRSAFAGVLAKPFSLDALLQTVIDLAPPARR